MDVIALTKKLMSIPSVSGDELPVLTYLYTLLPQYGFLLRKIDVGDGTYCIVAKKGTSDSWIVGHVDTVPGLVSIETKDGNLYGRGACDTKGNIAAAIVATAQCTHANLLLTVGEEDTFRGAKIASHDSEVREGKRYMILEPTSSEYMRGQLGAILVTLSATGTQKHSAFIEQDAENAIHTVVRALQMLREAQLPGFNVGTIHGGIAKNVVAHLCTAEIVLRPKTIKEHHETLALLQTIHTQLPEEASIEIRVSYAPLEGTPQVRGFTEAFFFGGEGKEVGVLGAGDLHVAHSPHEHVPIRELEALPGTMRTWVDSKSQA